MKSSPARGEVVTPTARIEKLQACKTGGLQPRRSNVETADDRARCSERAAVSALTYCDASLPGARHGCALAQPPGMSVGVTRAAKGVEHRGRPLVGAFQISERRGTRRELILPRASRADFFCVAWRTVRRVRALPAIIPARAAAEIFWFAVTQLLDAPVLNG